MTSLWPWTNNREKRLPYADEMARHVRNTGFGLLAAAGVAKLGQLAVTDYLAHRRHVAARKAFNRKRATGSKPQTDMGKRIKAMPPRKPARTTVDMPSKPPRTGISKKAKAAGSPDYVKTAPTQKKLKAKKQPNLRAAPNTNTVNSALRGKGGTEAIRIAKSQGIVPNVPAGAKSVKQKHAAVAAATYRQRASVTAAAGSQRLAAKFNRRAELLQRMAGVKPSAKPKTHKIKAPKGGGVAGLLLHAGVAAGVGAYALSQGATKAQAATVAGDAATYGAVSEYQRRRNAGNSTLTSAALAALKGVGEYAVGSSFLAPLQTLGSLSGSNRNFTANPLRAALGTVSDVAGTIARTRTAATKQRKATGIVKAHTRRSGTKIIHIGQRTQTNRERSARRPRP